MRIVALKNWAAFKTRVIDRYVSLDRNLQSLIWFRGQERASWALQSTLDRDRVFANDHERSSLVRLLLSQFEVELVGIGRQGDTAKGESLELLARHHGLPSPILDWTESPYIAAFFAFQSFGAENRDRAAVWALNWDEVPSGDEIERIQDRELLWYNPRAIEQRGVFMRVNSIRKPLDELLGDAVTKYVLPRREGRLALKDLEAMNLTARNLFRDLDGAARTALARVSLQ